MSATMGTQVARMSEDTVREIHGACGAVEFVVPLHSPHRMLVRVVNAHFPSASIDMRWSVALCVRTRCHVHSRTTLAGCASKLRADAREDEVRASSVPCVLDMALNTPWYNAIVLECESREGDEYPKSLGPGWFVDLAFDPYEPTAGTKTATTAAAAPSSATTATAAAPGASLTFPCPYCVWPYPYVSHANRDRHIRKCHGGALVPPLT